jgi:NAD(P)-dependent dehydrogenase (short-subunit alcohol dehydrogenase family)
LAESKACTGLVNNAGIVTLGPMTEIKEDELNWILDVNLVGVFRVTKAFAPLIIESKGRISNISSINPGNYRSKIGIREAITLAEQPYAQAGSPYAEAIASHIEYLSDRSMYKEPDGRSAELLKKWPS